MENHQPWEGGFTAAVGYDAFGWGSRGARGAGSRGSVSLGRPRRGLLWGPQSGEEAGPRQGGPAAVLGEAPSPDGSPWAGGAGRPPSPQATGAACVAPSEGERTAPFALPGVPPWAAAPRGGSPLRGRGIGPRTPDSLESPGVPTFAATATLVPAMGYPGPLGSLGWGPDGARTVAANHVATSTARTPRNAARATSPRSTAVTTTVLYPSIICSITVLTWSLLLTHFIGDLKASVAVMCPEG